MVECLARVHRALGSVSRIWYSCVAEPTYNPSTPEVEAEDPKLKIVLGDIVNLR